MKTDYTSQIAAELAKRIGTFSSTIVNKHVGHIVSGSDGVVKISGLPQVAYLERLEFGNNLSGVAISLEDDVVGAIVLGDYSQLEEGNEVQGTGELLSTPVGNQLLGRVIDPLGQPLDGKPISGLNKNYPLEKIAPSVVKRHPVNVPLQTGIKAIDAMIPIGRGQRELIIGDRNTGKTAIAIDTIINQKKENVVCIYVAIGQKTSRIAQVVANLNKYGAMEHTIVVSASAADSAAMQYLAPYAGCAIGEYFLDQGKDALVIYDDLSKHAWAYRQISLVLRRPSGREAYPGDVFYLHSRLLERACRLDEKCGGGSLTALPIIETQANDLSAYIPTNVISITDGQIFLESELFYAGQRPAVNIGLSVSRVGGAAQIKGMKKVAGNLRLDLAQYRELAAFVQFSADVDEATKKQIERGARMIEILKQAQYIPMPVEKQIVIIWAVTSGNLDDLPVAKITEFEQQFMDYLSAKERKLLSQIAKEKILNPEIEKFLVEAVTRVKKNILKT